MKNYNLWNTIKMYKWKSVFFKYLSSLFVIILIVLVPYNVILYSYYNYFSSYEIQNQSATNALKSKNIFDLLTSSFNANYNLACDTNFVNEFLSEKDKQQVYSISNTTQDFVSSMVSTSKYIDEIYIYSFTNDYLISSTELTHVNDNIEHLWLTTYMSTKLPFVMFPRKINSDTFNYLYVCSEMYNQDNDIVGIFCSRIKYSDFEDIIHKSFEEQPEKIFIVSDIGLILYSNDYDMINTLMFEKEDIYTAFNSAKATEGNSFTYDNYIISVAKSTNSNVILMSYSSENFLMRNYAFLSNLVIFATASILLISIAIALFISIKQYCSVVNVMDILKDPNKSHNDNALLSEFFYISNTISNISHTNETMSNELSNKIISLKQAQIAALQSQINPHFLFNTLQLINLSIIKEMKKDTVATNLISQLSELLRTSYDTDNYMITVKEEIENTQKYLNIQQARYKDRLHIFYNISKECADCKTLKLLLQPFVENAFAHGFKGNTDNWNLYINCYKEGNYVVYEIIDNGTGITQQRIDKIHNKLSQTKINTQNSIGITNVNARLKLLYGYDYSISITSNDVTTITIKHKG